MKETENGTYVLQEGHRGDFRFLEDTLWHGARSSLFALGLDVETKTAKREAKTPDPRRDTLVGVGLGLYNSADEHIAIYGLASDDYLNVLRAVLGSQEWYAFNAMFDATVLRRYGVRLGKHMGDARIAAYLSGEPDADLKTLLAKHFQYDVKHYWEVLEEWGVEDISQVPVEVQADYCALQDAVQCVRLAWTLEEELGERALQVYRDIELPMVNILVDMTERGIRFDRAKAIPMWEYEAKNRDQLDAVISQLVRATGFKQLEQRNGQTWKPTCKVFHNGKLKRVGCEACQGRGKLDPVERPFNPGSSDQVRGWLYDHMHAPQRRVADSGEPSTDALALLQLRGMHEAIGLMLTRRKFANRAAFLKSWIELSGDDGRLHTQYTNTRVVSGRLSSKTPNLQNVTQDLRVLFTADEELSWS